MLRTKQKSIRWSLASITTPQAPVPTFRKSQNQYLVSSVFLNRRSTSLSHWTDLWVPGIFLAVTTAGIKLSRKCDVTKRQSRPCIVTRRRYPVGRSVLTPVALNISQRCFIVWDVSSNCQAACNMPKHVNVIFADVLTWFFGNLTREIHSVWCFITSLRHCQMNEMKIKCQFLLSASYQTHVQF